MDGLYLKDKYPSVVGFEYFTQFSNTPDMYKDIAINPMEDPDTAKAALMDILKQVRVQAGIRPNACAFRPCRAPCFDRAGCGGCFDRVDRVSNAQ